MKLQYLCLQKIQIFSKTVFHSFTRNFILVNNLFNHLNHLVYVQIHEYMISKAPPVPQKTSEDTSEEAPTPVTTEVVADEVPVGPQNVNTEIIGNQEQHLEGNHEAPANEDREPEGPRVLRQVASVVPSASSSVQTVELQQEQVLRVQKPADDRLFTWAAVGLTIAIVVLILKKFMKANGPGAVFIDES